MSSVFDETADRVCRHFLDPNLPLRTEWWPRYQDTIRSVKTALDAGRPEDAVSIIWRERDNAISNAGQGVLGGMEVDRLAGRLAEVTAEILSDGSPENYDALTLKLEKWRASGELSRVPRLLLARAFAAIHPQRYHTTVDGPRQHQVIAWFEAHTGFIPPTGSWAVRAAALTAHLDSTGRFAEEPHYRNLFPWFVYERQHQGKDTIPFRPGYRPQDEAVRIEEREAHQVVVGRRHVEIQKRLYDELCSTFTAACVATEHATGTRGLADVLVKRGDGRYDLYEIKPADSAGSAIRQALGQLLEYAYWPGGLDPASMTVVSDAPLDDDARQYLATVSSKFNLTIAYRQCSP